jgi:putative ABC transport system permease protein
MRGERGYRRYLRVWLRRQEDVDRELDEEIEAHLAMRTDDLVRLGETPERARAEALRRFGDMAEARQRLRESARAREGRLMRGALLDDVRRDVLLGLRQARRSPGFSALAVATFALGIGLTTTMFTIVDRVLIRPLPFPGADRLVTLMSVDSAGNEFAQVSMGNWVDWREQSRSLEASALLRGWPMTLVSGEEAYQVNGQVVVGEFFDVLRPRMHIGRGFTVEEVQAGTPLTVVSEHFWRNRMAADTALGSITVDGRTVQVVGVIARGREYPAGTDVWRGGAPQKEGGGQRNNVNWQAIGRLRAGVTAVQARAELDRIALGIRESDPAGIYSYGVGVEPLHDQVVGDASRSLLLLMGGVSFVLLIACANLAGLGLARSSGRAPEVAMRMALGAGRWRVLQQLVTEVLVLALAGGLLGIGIAWGSARAVVSRFGAEIPRAVEIGVDARVIAVAILVTTLAGLLAALAPALKASRVPLRTLIGSERSAVRGGHNLPGAALVSGEIALALLLATTSTLLIRSFRAVLDQDLGFETEGIVTVDVVLASSRYTSDAERRALYWEELLERARQLPGVRSAGLGNWIPTGSAGATFLELDGVHDDRAGAGYRIVSDDYFRTLGIRLLAGRSFEATDAFGGERVALVNRSLAERYWPGESALGKRMRAVSMESEVAGGAEWLRIVGVVGDVRHWGHEEQPMPEMYVLHRQLRTSLTMAMTLVVGAEPRRTGEIHRAVRAEAASIDPVLAPQVSLLERRVGGLLAARRLTMTVLSGFGALALVLAAIGVYGLISFAVAQRTREIGVRAALGARRSGIVRLMLANALHVVGIGTIVGLVAAFWVNRLMSGLLFGVTPADLPSYLVAALTIAIASALAAFLPAWRASRLDPLVALRQK